jgi:hypothetical protein
MAATTTVTTPLPADITPVAVIKILHDHDAYIKLTTPLLVSYKLESDETSAADGTGVAIYTVTDKKPIGQVNYKLTLTNVGDGIESLVNAKTPMGALTIKTKWTVLEGTITEDVEVEANFVMKNRVKGNVEKSHAEFHLELIKMAAPVAA